MLMVSISIPARGATAVERRPLVEHDVSIHAPARGATLVVDALQDLLVVSIHAPARGATVKIIQYEAIPNKPLCIFLGTNDFK